MQEQRQAELAVKEKSIQKKKELEEDKPHLKLEEEELIIYRSADQQSILPHFISCNDQGTLMAVMRHMNKHCTRTMSLPDPCTRYATGLYSF